MRTVSGRYARKNLYQLIKDVEESHDPIVITGRDSSAVLISEGDWNAIRETLFLSSIPGSPESIREGLQTPLEDCDDSLEW